MEDMGGDARVSGVSLALGEHENSVEVSRFLSPKFRDEEHSKKKIFFFQKLLQNRNCSE